MDNRQVYIIVSIAIVSVIIYSFVNRFFISMSFIGEHKFSSTLTCLLSMIVTVIISILLGRLIVFLLKKIKCI